MSLKNLSLLEYLPSSKSNKNDNRITTLVILGMVFVLTFSLMGFAFMQFEYDDVPSIEGSTVTGRKEFLPVEAFLSGVQLAIFGVILIFEFLRSHIGEKRFAGRIIEVSDLSSIVSFLTTALLGSSFVLIASRKD